MVSFDIFDTLVTRITENPYGIFCIMQERLKQMNNVEGDCYSLIKDFPEIRRIAEKNAAIFKKNENGNKELDLEIIYQVFMKMTGISETEKNMLKKLEIQTEIDCAVGITSNIELLKRIYQSGERVVLISDMYLSSRDIRKILVSIDDIFENITIYVSNECGCSKQLGGLFLFVKERESLGLESWTHYGDNRLSDVDNAQGLGIKAIWYKCENLLPWEKEFEIREKNNWYVYWQLCIGISRVIRQNMMLTPNEQIGVSFGGMVLYSYVEWVIRNSDQQGIDTLYFVARDGYILKIIADYIIHSYKLNIKTKYIFGSRKAWRVQGKNKEDRERLYHYFKQEIDFSEKIAFVEVNGTGYTMECVSEIIETLSNQRIYIYYCTLKKNVNNRKFIFLTYLTEDEEIVEVLCRAPHGPTIGYMEENLTICPLIKEVDEAIWKKVGLLEYIHGIELLAENLAKISAKLGMFVGDRYLVKNVLTYIRDNPNKAILDFLKNIPHSNDNCKVETAYAPSLSQKDLFNIFMWRTTEELDVYYEGANIGYSQMALSEKSKKILKYYKKNYYHLLGKAVHYFKNIKINHKLLQIKGVKQKVVIYGAGEEGRRLYQYLSQEEKYKIIAWIDRNYIEYQKKGYPVKGIKELKKSNYELVIIAIKSDELRGYIKEMLLQMGIDSQKIILCNDVVF